MEQTAIFEVNFVVIEEGLLQMRLSSENRILSMNKLMFNPYKHQELVNTLIYD